MGDFKVGDRVRVNQAGMEFLAKHWPLHLEDYRDILSGPVGIHWLAWEDSGCGVEEERLTGEVWLREGDTNLGWVNREHIEPVSASLSACERVLWASTQEYVRAANTEAETKREGYLSAFRQVVEEDRPELAGKQWTVEDGQFVVQQ